MFITATTIYKWKYCEAAQGNAEIMPCSCMGQSQDQVWGVFLTDLPGWWWFYCVFAQSQNPLELFLAAGLHGCLIDISCQVIFLDLFCTWFMPRYYLRFPAIPDVVLHCHWLVCTCQHHHYCSVWFLLAYMWFCCGIWVSQQQVQIRINLPCGLLMWER